MGEFDQAGPTLGRRSRSGDRDGGRDEVESESELIVTYRFLRLGIVAAVVMLGIALIVEIGNAGCIQSSISAYYYTPVRSVFVGVLLAIGLSLIAVKGHGFVEDFFLNLAGMLAPVVALVPTGLPKTLCRSAVTTPLTFDAQGDEVFGGPLPDWVVANIKNNVPALLGTGLVALVVVVIVWLVTREKGSPLRPLASAVPKRTIRFVASLVVYVVVLGVAVVLYFTWNEVKAESHLLAAGVMFACFWVVVAANAWWRRNLTPVYRFWYRAIALLMPLAAAGIVVGAWRYSHDELEWEETVFWLEVAEIVLFAAFWVVQTRQRWWDEETGGTAQPPSR